MPKRKRHMVEVSEEMLVKINRQRAEHGLNQRDAIDNISGLRPTSLDKLDKLMKSNTRSPIRKPSVGIIDGCILYRFWYEHIRKGFKLKDITLPRRTIIHGVYNKLAKGSVIKEESAAGTWADIYPMFFQAPEDARQKATKIFRDEIDNRLKALVKSNHLHRALRGVYTLSNQYISERSSLWTLVHGILLIPPHKDLHITKL